MGLDGCSASEECYNYGGSYKCVNLGCPSGYKQINTRNADRYLILILPILMPVLIRRCLRQTCNQSDPECPSKPYQISYHIMSHTSPVIAEKVLFKLTLMKSSDLSKTFRLVKGNEDNYFKVNSFIIIYHLQ